MTTKAARKREPSRFAHPFITNAPPATRPASPYGQRMTDWASQDLGPIPKPSTKDSVLQLKDLIGSQGAAEIEAAGAIRFHLTGDTGRVQGEAAQSVSDCMSSDYDPGRPGSSPACFIHLGDVIYGPHKDALYRDEFYRPYTHYPGKIIAIPGNHDGEVFPTTDPKSLTAFVANFCASAGTLVPTAAAARILRPVAGQPGVYWWLQTPFVDVVGLYTNFAEGPGYLEGGPQTKRDNTQIAWLGATLKKIAQQRAKARKGLVFATHHPPYSNGGGHSGSPQLLKEMDDACSAAKVWPDLVISGHAHSYQRHTRTMAENGSRGKNVPYLVAGCGGRGLQHVDKATGQQISPGVTFDKAIMQYGYVLLEANKSGLTAHFVQVDEHTAKGTRADSVSVGY